MPGVNQLNQNFLDEIGKAHVFLSYAVLKILPDKGMTALHLNEDGNFEIQYKSSYVGKVQGLPDELEGTIIKVHQKVTGRVDKEKGIIQFDPGAFMIDVKGKVCAFFCEKTIEIGTSLTEISVDMSSSKQKIEMTGKSRSEGFFVRAALKTIKSFFDVKGEGYSLTGTVFLKDITEIHWKKA